MSHPRAAAARALVMHPWRAATSRQLIMASNHPRLPARHEDYMALALRLASRAAGRTAPNPMVGAVVVNGGRVVGRGYHRRAGLPHAEVVALRRAGRLAEGATLYVTLEPCNHTGRTPPCCEAILASGVSRVVVAMRDPNPVTDGRGIARLRRGGIPVATGVLRRQAEQLNEPFCKAMTAGLPFVVAKVGQSLDGKIATREGESRWITSEPARRLAHQWRRRVDAIVIGIKTVLVDDPLLTARGGPARPGRPIKVVVDSRLRIPLSARCLSGESPAPTWVATTVTGGKKRRALARRGAAVITLPSRRGRMSFVALCRVLARRGVQSALIEGGGETLAGAFAERIVDRVVWLIAPVLIGGRHAPSSLGGDGIRQLGQAIRLTDVTCRRVGPDICVEGRVVYPGRRGGGMRPEVRSRDRSARLRRSLGASGSL